LLWSIADGGGEDFCRGFSAPVSVLSDHWLLFELTKAIQEPGLNGMKKNWRHNAH